MAKYKVGDVLYHAKCRWEPVQKQCPVCCGKKEVILILGNDDQVILPCENCAKGWDGPRGYVSEYEYVVDPETVVITTVEITVTENAEKAEYRSGHFCFKEDMLFTYCEEAIEVGKRMKHELEIEQETRAECIKKDKNKSYAWNAGYHMREVKHHKERMAYHEKMARICKERSREVSDGQG